MQTNYWQEVLNEKGRMEEKKPKKMLSKSIANFSNAIENF